MSSSFFAIGALMLLLCGFVLGAAIATDALQEETALHCGAYFHPNDGEFTWVKCAEGLE